VRKLTIGIQRISIDDIILPSQPTGIAKIKDLSVIETLLNRKEVEFENRKKG